MKLPNIQQFIKYSLRYNVIILYIKYTLTILVLKKQILKTKLDEYLFLNSKRL